MANISFNARHGISVGTLPTQISDNAGNITAVNLVATGTIFGSTLAASLDSSTSGLRLRSSTLNTPTSLTMMPNGTSQISGLRLYNKDDITATNIGGLDLTLNGVTATLSPWNVGTGLLPTTLSIGFTTSISATGGLSVTSGPISIGSGVTGLILQSYTLGSGGAIYNAGVTPGSTNYSYLSSATSTWLNATASTILGINNAAVLSVTSSGASVIGSLSASSIQNTPIGSVTPSSGAFTTIVTSSNVTISGNLIVNGSTTTVNTTSQIVQDKHIELGSVTAITGLTGTATLNSAVITNVNSTTGIIPGQAVTVTTGPGAIAAGATVLTVDSTIQLTLSAVSTATGAITFNIGGMTDSTASGGGVILRGLTSKTILWNNVANGWESSENIQLATGKTFRINGVDVISSTALGTNVVSSVLTSVGTIGTGTWQGNIIAGQFGGTGIANTGKTITLAGNLITTGAFNITFTAGATVALTLPSINGTLATLANSEAFTNKTYNGLTITSSTGTLTIAAAKVATVSNTLTLAGTDGTTMTFPTTSATVARTDAANIFTGVQTMTSPAITTPAFTGIFSGSYSLGGTPTINVALAVGGTWTAAATWTIPAVTLNGTISGGGNQINNVIIGASTPLAGYFTSGIFSTTLGVTGLITSTGGISGGAASHTTGTFSGAVTATNFNALSLTSALIGFTVAGGTTSKTLTVSNTLALAGTDGTTMTFPGTNATIARTDAGQTFTGTQAFGIITASSINGNAITAGTGTLTLGTGSTLVTSATNSITLTSTAATNVILPTTGTLSTLAGAETLTSKTISGASNTLTAIPNTSLTNSSVTIGNVAVALGGTATTLTGLTGVTATTFTGALSGTVSASTGSFSGVITSTVATGTAPFTVASTTPVVGLNISGNAATATTATNVAYTGLTGTVPTWNQSTTGNAATATNVAYTGLTGTVPTWNQSTTGNAATATNVAYTGLTGTVPTWNQNTTGNAATATNVAYTGLTGTIPTWNQSTTGNAATATSIVGQTQFGILYQSAASTTASTVAGTAKQVLASNGASAPTFQSLDLTYLPTSSFKESVNAATTADLGAASSTTTTLTGGLVAFPTQDGITSVLNNRYLVKDQNTQTQNGIYVLTTLGAVGTAWVLTRPVDADTSLKIAESQIAVDDGTLNGGKLFRTLYKTSGILGTTPIIFYEVADTASVQTLTNKTISGAANTLSAIPNTSLTNSSITIGNVAVALGTAVTTITGLTGVTATTFTGALSGTVSATTGSFSGVITSTIATGTAPFTVASVTPVTNLNIGGNAATATTATNVAYTGLTGTVPTWNQSTTGNAATATTSTNIAGGNTTTLLGSIPYQSGTNTTTQLSPNTTITKQFLSQTGTGTNGAAPVWSIVAKADVGLGLVENTALSTWLGTANVTTLGTITAGTWNATAIADGKIAAALTGKTYNGLTITTSNGTLTVAALKTLTASNSITLAGTDGTTMTFPGTNATIARTDAANTFTGTQTISTLTVTTVNGNILSAGTGTLSLGTGSTLVTSATNSITLTSTAATNVTLPTTGTLSTLAGIETLTNKSISGSTNTITAIPNTSLTNSSVTIGNVAVALGGTVTTITGLTGVTATTFTGALSGNAASATFASSSATATMATNIAGGNTTTLLGSIPYQSGTNTTTQLSPNTTMTKQFLSQTGTGTNGAAPVWSAVVKADIGLNVVENTALSTWVGTSNVTTLGTITAGTWNATAIADGNIAAALTGKTYNGLSLTATAAGFTVAGGTSAKTLTVSNSITLAGADLTTMTFPGTNATIARTDAGQTFTGTQAFDILTATTVNGQTIPTGTGTLSTLAGAETLTSKTISGVTNTLIAIPNGALSNSSVTIGNVSVALGGTATTLTGLTGVTATTFTGTLSGAATTATNVTGTVAIVNGGTGATSAGSALTNILPGGTVNGYVLKTSGPGSFFWAAETGGSPSVGTTISSSRLSYTATAGQTVFTAPTYTVGASQLRVYVDGVRQFPSEYTETNTTTVTMNAPGIAVGALVLIEVDGYISNTVTAASVTNTATGSVPSGNVQGAIADLESRKANATQTPYLTASTGSVAMPSGTTGQRDGIPAFGYSRANSTLNQMEWYNGTNWTAMGGGATGAPGNNIFFENDQVVTANYTITSGKNAMTAGPITISTGVVVTIPSGSVWTIV